MNDLRSKAISDTIAKYMTKHRYWDGKEYKYTQPNLESVIGPATNYVDEDITHMKRLAKKYGFKVNKDD